MKTLAEIRRRAWLELITNRTITVYDFVDGYEVNRHRPLLSFDRLSEAFNQMRNALANISFEGLTESIKHATAAAKRFTDAMSVELEPPLCIICGRPETYADGEWYCRSCERDI